MGIHVSMTRNSDDAPPDPPLLRRALEEHSRQQAVEILENPVRRQVLHDLDAEEGTVSLSELAERVADPNVRGASSVERRSSRADAEVTPTERVALQLHHVHLPKLDDHGLEEYDRDEKTVTAETTS